MYQKIIVNIFIFLSVLLFVDSLFAATVYSDSTITSHVKSKIASTPSLIGKTIFVDTENGIVTLTGNVDSDAEASTATEVAQSVAGVRDVDTSKLTVKESQQPFTDTLITAKIKGLFIQHKLFGDKDVAAMSISVETTDGIVSLSGTADNQEQINNAIKIAKTVSGVKQVKSDVKISVSNNSLGDQHEQKRY